MAKIRKTFIFSGGKGANQTQIDELKVYVDDTVSGAGAVAGKPCQIQSVTDITGGHRVTFLWVDNSGSSHTSSMDVMDGADGLSVTGAAVNADNSFTFTMSDGTEYTTAPVSTVKGDEGKSAYEVAVDEGYSGTEEEWLESLKGDEGVSPTVEVKESTETRYVLTITDKDGSFDTPNLKGGEGGAVDSIPTADITALFE